MPEPDVRELLAAIQKIMASDDEELKQCVQMMIKAWELLLDERRASSSKRYFS